MGALVGELVREGDCVGAPLTVGELLWEGDSVGAGLAVGELVDGI